MTVWLYSWHPTSADVTVWLDADGQRVGQGMASVLLTTAGPNLTPSDVPQKVEVPFTAAPVPAGARLVLSLSVDHTDALERGRGGDWSTVLQIG